MLKSLQAHDIKMDKANIVYISEEVVSNASGTKLYPMIFDKLGIKYDRRSRCSTRALTCPPGGTDSEIQSDVVAIAHCRNRRPR